MKYIVFILRLILGGVFLFSGYMKAQDINGFSDTLLLIKLISSNIAYILSIIIIFLELSIGIFLILGLYLKNILKLTIILLIIFTLYFMIVLIFNIKTSCGCFGDLSKNNITFTDILRNIILLTVVIFIFLKSKLYPNFSIDKYILQNK